MAELMLMEAPLIEQLQRVANHEQISAEALLVQVVTDYLARKDVQATLEEAEQPYDSAAIHAAFLEEKAAFQRLKPELLARYRGKAVAIYQGQVVASGSDRMDVYGVVLEKFGQVPCYIEYVVDQPPRPKRMPLIRKVRWNL